MHKKLIMMILLMSTTIFAQSFPKKTELAAYRVKLRDWPSTSDFPDTRPTL